MAEQIIKLASFPYKGADGVERTALRGDKVDITDQTDLERGERLGVFATDEDLKEGTVFGDFYAQRETQRKLAEAQAEAEPVVPAVEKKPTPATSKPRPIADAKG